MPSMSALLDALKQAEGASSFNDPGEKLAAKQPKVLTVAKGQTPSALSDVEMEADPADVDLGPTDDPGMAERNAQIAEILETDYPDVFEEINAQIDSADTEEEPAEDEEALV